MNTSQNGWPVLSADQTALWTIPGTGRHFRLARGPAGLVLAHMLLFVHERVERLDVGVWDDWGWAPRPIRGSTTTSNHASGTAADANATRHPLGIATDRTFTAQQQRRIRRRLRTFGGVIRWGGDYTKRPDAMHFELNRGTAAVTALAKVLAKTPRGRRILAINGRNL